MSGFRAILDANVLYPAYLRDVLAEVAVYDFYRPLWSAEILRETQSALERHNPRAAANFPRICGLLNETFPDANVAEFGHLIGALECPDPNDAHVLAAAIVGEAGALVTFDLSGFPQDISNSYGIDLLHPDDFLQDLADLNNRQFLRAIGRLLASYSSPALGPRELAHIFLNVNCPGFASHIIRFEEEIEEAYQTHRHSAG